MNICGDFLQLPPVDTDGSRRSLALPLDAVGEVVVEEDDKTTKTTQAHLADARQGFELWRSIRRVVCLTVNIRAPDTLGRLQEEMRGGKVSDEMWNFYLSRVMNPQDSRLTSAPFNDKNVQLIFHLHRIRVMHSYDHAMHVARTF